MPKRTKSKGKKICVPKKYTKPRTPPAKSDIPKLPGQPTKMTAEIVKKIEEAFCIGCDVSEACFYAGISRQTYYVFIKKHKEYADRFDELQQTPILHAKDAVVKSFKKNPGVALRYLQLKKSSEFKSRNVVEPDIPAELDKEEKKEIAKAFAKMRIARAQ